MGLRKSQEGWQATDENTTVKKSGQSKLAEKLMQKAIQKVSDVVEMAVTETKVPEGILQ